MAMVHPPKSLFVMFHAMFPQYGSEENCTYYQYGTNGIRIRFNNNQYPIMIFRYHSSNDWELLTEHRDEETANLIDNLQKELRLFKKKEKSNG